MNEPVIRRAAQQDSKKIFNLSNDPDVRAASFNTAEIPWREHTTWFSAILNNPKVLFLVAECSTGFVGQVRFTQLTEEQALLSISVTPEFRKTPYSVALLTQSLETLRDTFPNTREVIAKVRKENIRSQKFLEKLEFKKKTTQSEENAVVLALVVSR